MVELVCSQRSSIKWPGTLIWEKQLIMNFSHLWARILDIGQSSTLTMMIKMRCLGSHSLLGLVLIQCLCGYTLLLWHRIWAVILLYSMTTLSNNDGHSGNSPPVICCIKCNIPTRDYWPLPLANGTRGNSTLFSMKPIHNGHHRSAKCVLLVWCVNWTGLLEMKCWNLKLMVQSMLKYMYIDL